MCVTISTRYQHHFRRLRCSVEPFFSRFAGKMISLDRLPGTARECGGSAVAAARRLSAFDFLPLLDPGKIDCLMPGTCMETTCR